MIEEWRTIARAPDYRVSNLGRIQSVDRHVPCAHNSKRLHRGRILSPSILNTGYLSFKAGKYGSMHVHVAVAEAFLGERPHGLHVAHWDGIRTNNVLSNLRWATPKENVGDRRRHGTAPLGEAVHNSKLTTADVLAIRLDGRRRKDIANDFGVTPEAISHIVLRKTWKWLE